MGSDTLPTPRSLVEPQCGDRFLPLLSMLQCAPPDFGASVTQKIPEKQTIPRLRYRKTVTPFTAPQWSRSTSPCAEEQAGLLQSTFLNEAPLETAVSLDTQMCFYLLSSATQKIKSFSTRQTFCEVCAKARVHMLFCRVVAWEAKFTQH